MMASDWFYLVKDLGFPVFMALVLLYDKMKMGEKMITVVATNTEILRRIEKKI